jgi:hypothetical protein
MRHGAIIPLESGAIYRNHAQNDLFFWHKAALHGTIRFEVNANGHRAFDSELFSKNAD